MKIKIIKQEDLTLLKRALKYVLSYKIKDSTFCEATSPLDNESQFYIKKAIDTVAKNCTAVLIAHRLSTIIEAHVILCNGQRKSS